MKKRQNNSARASALQITLSVALMSVSAILFASSFRAATPAAPGSPQQDIAAKIGQLSQNAALRTSLMNPLLRQRLSKVDSTHHFLRPRRSRR